MVFNAKTGAVDIIKVNDDVVDATDFGRLASAVIQISIIIFEKEQQNCKTNQPDLMVFNVKTDVVDIVIVGDGVVDVADCGELPLESEIGHRI